jgi:hypothetical protein
MSATIYITPQAMETAAVLHGLDYYDRCSLTDEGAVDWTAKEGYYLKNADVLKVAALPENASIALRLHPESREEYVRHVSMPANLRGCLFEKAPFLPDDYASIVRYWSGLPVNANVSGAVYYQNPHNAYLVDLSALDELERYDRGQISTADIDALLSEGVVISINGLGSLLKQVPRDQYIEIVIPVDESMLGLDNGSFWTDREYDLGSKERRERLFLKVEDIYRSPNPDQVYIDALRYEQLDYGYHY